METVNTAIRISDGAQVTLKILGSAPVDINEIKLCRLFSSAPHNSNPANHCVPVYEVLEMPEKGTNFLVMPFLSFWERPPFETVGEAVDCIGQMFQVRLVDYCGAFSHLRLYQGLAFMHNLNIAHK